MKVNKAMQDIWQKQIDTGRLLKLPNKLTGKVGKMKEFKETYKLVQKLSSVNGFGVSRELLHRTMFNSEALPPLGKEYWWFLFIGQNGEKPIQLMFLVFRKHGKRMSFNDKSMVLKSHGKNKFQAVTACWVWDGKKLHDLGDTNATTTINSKKKSLISKISNHKAVFRGKFPNFELKIGDAINLNMTELKRVDNKDAYGVFFPPFGMGWVNAFSIAKGTVFGKEFKGTAHLQKVVGITTFGCFNWGKIFFQKGSSVSFFCVKPEKNSKKLFYQAISFYDHETKKVIKFKRPKLKILKKEGKKKPEWVITGRDKDKELKIVLETYAEKQFTMKDGEWQVYIEYAVTAKEFSLKTKDRKTSLNGLGRGVGNFEDAYGFVF